MEKEKKKLLIFENSLFLLEVYLSELLKANYEVVTAATSDDCLRLAGQKPDLVLIDIMAPKINGIEILRCLKENPETKDIAVVILASIDQEKIIAEVLKMGAQGFLLKEHLSPTDLVRRINEFLENPETKLDQGALVES